MELATLGNVYFDANKPWTLSKDPATHSQMNTVLYCCFECLKALALTAFPLIPSSAQKLWEMIGQTTQLETQNWRDTMESPLKPQTPFPTPEPLFKKVEEAVIEKEEALLKNKPATTTTHAPLKDPIDYDTFAKLDLRIGQILHVEAVPKSKKLLKLTVDLGFEKRTIVSGISPFFDDPQTLVGKKVIVVANLKPAKLMGIESQGMVICANVGTSIELPDITKASPGDQVY